MEWDAIMDEFVDIREFARAENLDMNCKIASKGFDSNSNLHFC